MTDLRYAARQFKRSPFFFLSAATLIALGIAANTQIFTLVNALLLRPLPIRDPQSLVQLFQNEPKRPSDPYLDYAFLTRLAERSTTLTDLAGQFERTDPVDRGTTVDRAHPIAASTNFFTSLGVNAALGRVFAPADTHVAVLSDAYWTRAFGRDPRAVGQTVRIKGHVYQIIGVTPPEFTGIILDSAPDLWIPYESVIELSERPTTLDNYSSEIIARLRPGVTLAAARAETESLWRAYIEEVSKRRPGSYSGFEQVTFELRSIAHGRSPIRDQSATALVMAAAGAGLLLLMVCANVGGLLLARATAREKETAVRLAIGAGRARILRQWLTESLLLTSVAGAAGIALAFAGMPLLTRLLPPTRGIGFDPAELRSLSLNLRPDFRVIAFSIVLCGLTAILAALAPAWRSSRSDLSIALKNTIGDARHQRFQSLLVAVQVALCTVLLFAAGLMTRTFEKLHSLDPGFDRDHVVIFQIDPHLIGYDSAQTFALEQRLVNETRRLPGVTAAALAGRALMRGIGIMSRLVFPGRPPERVLNSSLNAISPGYFDVMGMHVLAGRPLVDADFAEEGAVQNVVINHAFAERFFPGQNPLGQVFGAGLQYVKPQFVVVGVVNDSHYRSLREVPPPIYYSNAFGPKAYPNTFILHVRTAGDPRAIEQSVTALIRGIDPRVPVYQVATLAEEVDRSLWQERILATLASSFGVFALTLSAIGLYGILAYFVNRSRREIGLRLALGAESGHLVWLIAKRVIPMLAAGLAAGAVLSIFASKWVGGLLYGIEPLDRWSAAIALASLAVIALAAAAAPASRALRVDPASTLREE